MPTRYTLLWLLPCSLSLLSLSVADSPLPFPFDSFLIQAPASHLLQDVDTPEIILHDAWVSVDAGRYSPLPGLLPKAPVLLKLSRARAEQLTSFAHTQDTTFTLFVQTCVRLLEEMPVLPSAMTPIGARPVSFFPSSLTPDSNGDRDGSICFTTAELPLHDVLQPHLSLKCTGHETHDTCEYSCPQLHDLHSSATIDSDGAPPLLLHRIYSSRSTLYARGSGDPSDASASSKSMLLHSTASLVIYRNTIPFAYLVQAEGAFNPSHLLRRHSISLHVQWKYRVSSNDSFFLPNSTQNDGRNALWTEIRHRYPLTRFLYYIFMDEDVQLREESGRSSLDCRGCSPHELFEKYILHYQPALAVPRFPQWHEDDGSEVQLLHSNFNFDHILVAVRAEAATMFLPTETRFDSECWWLGQSIWSMVARAFYHDRTIQVNSVTTYSMQNRPLEDSLPVAPPAASGAGVGQSASAAAVAGKKYMRCQRFHPAFLWFMSSIKDDKVLLNLSYSILSNQFYDRRMLLHMGSRFVAPPDGPPLHPPPPTPPPPLPSPPRDDFGVDLRLVDCCHPYWRSHGLTWQLVESKGAREWAATGCEWEKNWMRQQCFTHAPYDGADASDLYRMIQYQYRLIKEGAEPQIAHLQHSVQQQQKYIDALLADQQQMQQRLQTLEKQIASKN